MGETISVHFKEEDRELYEFIERLHKEGDYANRSHAVTTAIKHFKKEKGSELIV